MTILKFTQRYGKGTVYVVKEHITYWEEDEKDEESEEDEYDINEFTNIYVSGNRNSIVVKETAKEVKELYENSIPLTF